jgi:hypothetical protein
MERTPVDSSLIKSIGYEDDVLEVEFKSKPEVWQYSGVSQQACDSVLSATSVGKAFLNEIKGRYPSERVS